MRKADVSFPDTAGRMHAIFSCGFVPASSLLASPGQQPLSDLSQPGRPWLGRRDPVEAATAASFAQLQANLWRSAETTPIPGNTTMVQVELRCLETRLP